ncbi:hypothetical protein HYH03_005070 [Edaphochlamys debaryana]|uniref:Protein kinase domain-containing protein n=1 Tax=Edaphochlamys debaryana TaxID=47281 RepID=A0A835YG98_9CHLO|nr:hypothetical protein HYH03_005070 [Edaphochlamys debaryana]|eukprot:KAG2497074.1 hypothetical protein HYH03_005070 [Edaphochlamys debaryana]
MKPSGKVLAVLLLPSLLAYTLAITTKRVYSGRELASAISSGENVSVVYIGVPFLNLTDSDWEGVQPLPVPLSRNLTLTGAPELPEWPLLVLWSTRKLILTGGGVFTLQNLLLYRYRHENGNRPPGLDILAMSPRGPNGGSLVLQGTINVLDFCENPVALAAIYGIVLRPAVFPGRQHVDVAVPQPGCSNTSALFRQRCCDNVDHAVDLSMDAGDFDASGFASANYYYRALDVRTCCLLVLPPECRRDYSDLGCWAHVLSLRGNNSDDRNLYYMHGDLFPAWAADAGGLVNASTQPLPPMGQGGGGGSGSDGSTTAMAVGVGVGVGGAALVAAAALLAAAWARRRGGTGNMPPDTAAAKAGDDGGGGGAPLPPGDSSSDTLERAAAHITAAHTSSLTDPGPGPGPGPGPEQRSLADGEAGPGALLQSGPQQRCRRSDGPSPMSTCSVSLASSLPVTHHTPFTAGLDTHASLADPEAVAAAVAASEAGLVDFGGFGGGGCSGSSGGCRAAAGGSSGSAGGGVGPGPQPAASQAPSEPGSGPNDDAVRLIPGQLLGKGGFATVHAGTYRGMTVAVKILRSGEAGGSDGSSVASRETLNQELEILARCRHPNVVRLLAACLDLPRPFMVLEKMETSLDKLLYGKGPGELLPLGLVLMIASEIACGLDYLHPTILHRDLKPANVLISDPWGFKPVVKLSDFGLSRLRATVVHTVNPEAGTACYLAPECFDLDSQIITYKADMWSFGTLLWECLAGAQPWKGFTPVQIAFQINLKGLRLPVPPLNTPGGADPCRWPPRLVRLVGECLDTDPQRRPAAAEVAKWLAVVAEGLRTPSARELASQRPQTADGPPRVLRSSVDLQQAPGAQHQPAAGGIAPQEPSTGLET